MTKEEILIPLAEFKGEIEAGEQFFNHKGELRGTFTGFETPFGYEVKLHNGGFCDLEKSNEFAFIKQVKG